MIISIPKDIETIANMIKSSPNLFKGTIKNIVISPEKNKFQIFYTDFFNKAHLVETTINNPIFLHFLNEYKINKKKHDEMVESDKKLEAAKKIIFDSLYFK